MFTKKPQEDPKLNKAIDELYEYFDLYTPDKKEYAAAAEQLTVLMKIKQNQKPDRVSKDVLATILANLLGIGMIIGYERTSVIASKALGFVMKAR